MSSVCFLFLMLQNAFHWQEFDAKPDFDFRKRSIKPRCCLNENSVVRLRIYVVVTSAFFARCCLVSTVAKPRNLRQSRHTVDWFQDNHQLSAYNLKCQEVIQVIVKSLSVATFPIHSQFRFPFLSPATLETFSLNISSPFAKILCDSLRINSEPEPIPIYSKFWKLMFIPLHRAHKNMDFACTKHISNTFKLLQNLTQLEIRSFAVQIVGPRNLIARRAIFFSKNCFLMFFLVLFMEFECHPQSECHP